MRLHRNNLPTAFLLLIAGSAVLLATGCARHTERAFSEEKKQQILDYWYSGVAELNRYELHQARYGTLHDGEAVLIFVTEDFLTNTQVKQEHETRENAVSVLKMNASTNFFTGIYPYSIMTSTFTPVFTTLPTLKVSNSVQEWCGHTYVQLNYRGASYEGRLHSYFQDEADDLFRVDGALLEDEVWTLLRIDPDALPTGDVQIIPGLMHHRFLHIPVEVREATVTHREYGGLDFDGDDLMSYRIEYDGLPRTMEIVYRRTFPHEIMGWRVSGRGVNDQVLDSIARRTNVLRTDYWNKNGPADTALRRELGLKTRFR